MAMLGTEVGSSVRRKSFGEEEGNFYFRPKFAVHMKHPSDS